jgi:hypothetical protein
MVCFIELLAELVLTFVLTSAIVVEAMQDA